jgi:hypothetical protein
MTGIASSIIISVIPANRLLAARRSDLPLALPKVYEAKIER